MDEITSAKNPLVRLLKSLSDRAARAEAGLILVEGEVMIREALACGLVPREAMGLSEKSAFLESLPCRAHVVPEDVLRAAADTKTPQGVCAAFEAPAPVRPDALPQRVVALNGVQDPGNAGTIWRTADAAGIQGVLFGEGCADALSPKVLRAAMGSGFRLPYARTDDLAWALLAMRERGYSILCSVLDGTDFYARGETGERFVLVIGSEAHGVSDAVRQTATHLLRLPMRGGAESLNAAVAAGIMMYELMRVRGG
jgi:TrmH family RNA methyltransferase